jgi:hypothetical protein
MATAAADHDPHEREAGDPVEVRGERVRRRRRVGPRDRPPHAPRQLPGRHGVHHGGAARRDDGGRADRAARRGRPA